MEYPYEVGTRVRALVDITEGGDDYLADPKAGFPQKNYIHALDGDLGTVLDISQEDLPTVRFDRTGTATVVMEEEIDQAFDA